MKKNLKSYCYSNWAIREILVKYLKFKNLKDKIFSQSKNLF